MKVIVNYLDGSRKVYDNCDDIDVDPDYIDVYTDPAGEDEPCIGLDLNLVKTVFTETILPDGTLDVSRVYFNKKSVKINSKKEVKTMKKEVISKEEAEAIAAVAEEKTAAEAEAEAEEAEEAEAAASEDDEDDFDFAESFNRKGKLFTIDTTDFEGHKAAEVYKDAGSEPLIMKAVFINKDNGFGESVSVVTPNGIIYFSKTNLDAAHNIRDNEKAVNRLNKTGALFRITEYESKKFKKKGYGFEFLKKDEIPEYLKNFMKTGEIGSDAPEDAALFRW